MNIKPKPWPTRYLETLSGIELDIVADVLYGLARGSGETDDALRGRCQIVAPREMAQEQARALYAFLEPGVKIGTDTVVRGRDPAPRVPLHPDWDPRFRDS